MKKDPDEGESFQFEGERGQFCRFKLKNGGLFITAIHSKRQNRCHLVFGIYSDLRPSTNRKHFLAFVYVWNGAFAILNSAFAVGNVIVIEVQTRLRFDKMSESYSVYIQSVCAHSSFRAKEKLNEINKLDAVEDSRFSIDLSGNYVTTAWKWGWGAQANAYWHTLGPLSLTSMQLWRNYRKGLLRAYYTAYTYYTYYTYYTAIVYKQNIIYIFKIFYNYANFQRTN